MKRLLTFSFLLTLVTAPAQAFMFLGDPVEGNSWSQTFHAVTGPYDFLRVDWVSGVMFTPTVIYNFDVSEAAPTWSSGWSLGTGGSATGLAADVDLTFDLHFEGNVTDQTAFHFNAYDFEDNITDSALAEWDGERWTLTNDGWEPVGSPRSSPIPEPSGLVVMGSILAAAGFSRLRGRRTKTG